MGCRGMEMGSKESKIDLGGLGRVKLIPGNAKEAIRLENRAEGDRNGPWKLKISLGKSKINCRAAGYQQAPGVQK
jgi:hypothetical protein